jgi:hypothetical protein
MKRYLLLFLLAGCAFAEDPPDFPNPKFTPGATTELTSDTLCDPAFHTRSIRHVSMALRKAVFAEYGIPYEEHAGYELDHFIPLCLGGSNDETNLWPEHFVGAWGAHTKDHLAVRLHAMVCRGEISLRDAQEQIRSNWIETYKRVFHE